MPRRVRITAAVAVLCGCLPGTAGAAAAASPCPNATVVPTAATLLQAREAVLCLINAERTKRGVPKLRVSPQLRRAALAHSADMVRRHYFSHITPAGLAPRARIKRTGYINKNNPASVNETLAIGSGELAAPAALVRQLIDDAPHRRIVVSRRYRDIGIGLILGYAADAARAGGVTLTVNYGRR